MHNFVKNDSKFENKGLFYTKFYGAWHKKKLDPKAVTWVWGLKTSLGQFGAKDLTKPLESGLVG